MRWVFCLKQGQRRDVRVQRRDVPERRAANVTTFQREEQPMSRRSREGSKPTSRRWDPMSRRCKEDVIQRCDILEKGKTDVATLREDENPFLFSLSLSCTPSVCFSFSPFLFFLFFPFLIQIPLCSYFHFSLIFLIFFFVFLSFPFFFHLSHLRAPPSTFLHPQLDTWLNMSHSS